MKLIIMFFAGLVLAGGAAWYLLSGTVPSIEDKIILVFPAAIGVALMLLSGSKALGKFDSYLDK